MVQTVTIHEAYDAGVKAFDHGANYQDAPKHYTPHQKDLWEAGFSKRSVKAYGEDSPYSE